MQNLVSVSRILRAHMKEVLKIVAAEATSLGMGRCLLLETHPSPPILSCQIWSF